MELGTKFPLSKSCKDESRKRKRGITIDCDSQILVGMNNLTQLRQNLTMKYVKILYPNYTFGNYILQKIDPNDCRHSLHPLYHRLFYIADVIKQGISEGSLLENKYSYILETVHILLDESRINNLSPSIMLLAGAKWCESLTRLQANSELWHIFRQMFADSIIGKVEPNGTINTAGHITTDLPSRGQTESILFGTRNESLAKSLIAALCVSQSSVRTIDNSDKKNEFDNTTTGILDIEKYSCGLMIDIRTGMLGASLDMVMCNRNRHGILAPCLTDNNIETYEIKCRFKYAFCPEMRSELSQCYERLMATKTVQWFRRFLYTIDCPCVDYFRPDNYPRAKEALITSDDDWKVGHSAYHAAQSRIKCNEFEMHHLTLNKNMSSRVWLFGEPDLQTNSIYPLLWNTGERVLSIPIFANPRHQNFKQIFLQSYVASGYFGNRKIVPFLATFIGRHRRQTELGRCFSLFVDDTEASEVVYEITPEQAIPVILIITPVIIDNTFYVGIEESGYRAFGELVDHLWAKQCRI
ncbi:UL12 [Gallid alphaherpesvirus 2]|uniref:UL12 n=1 Tax=Gallid alphaherpesvirus 2 TaxID=10390 RepID=Q9IBW3_9ALPH|nr:UL12 [Gallid alphaherpesvirus 2]